MSIIEKYGQPEIKKYIVMAVIFLVVYKSKTTTTDVSSEFLRKYPSGHTGSNINRDVLIKPLRTIAVEHIIIFMFFRNKYI